MTTGKAWEEILTEAVGDLVGGRRFKGVGSSGLDADELHKVPREELERRMKEAVNKLKRGGGEAGTGEGNGARGLGVAVLGCAGMVGLEEIVRGELEEGGRVVDGVVAGVRVLVGLVGNGY